MRRTKAEQHKIIIDVYNQIIKGVNYSEIIGELRERYKICKDMAAIYYTKASKRIKENAEKTMTQMREVATAQYNDLYKKADMIEDLKDSINTKVKIRERIDKISGIESNNINIDTAGNLNKLLQDMFFDRKGN